ncbi:MAG: Hsp20/alpha crystallin family protein [Pseudomonadota bacterium]
MSRYSRHNSTPRQSVYNPALAFTPFHFLDDMRREMDDLVGSYLSGLDTSRSRNPGRGEEASQGFIPDLDIDREDDHYIISIEAPGVKPDDLSIEIEDGVLTISGEKHEEREAEDCARRERRYGRFTRAIRLAEDIDQEAISASHEHGVLTIELPKRALDQERKRRISIDARGEASEQQIEHRDQESLREAEKEKEKAEGRAERHAKSRDDDDHDDEHEAANDDGKHSKNGKHDKNGKHEKSDKHSKKDKSKSD